MQLEKLGPVVRSYDWKFIECKNCEVCHLKGDDVSQVAVKSKSMLTIISLNRIEYCSVIVVIEVREYRRFDNEILG